MTSPDRPVPEKALTFQQISALQDYDPDNNNPNGDLLGFAEIMRGNFFTKILGGFLSVPKALGDLLGNIVGAITGGQFFDLGGLSSYGSGQRGDIADLQDKYQNLGGVIGYGCATSYDMQGQVGGGKYVVPFGIQIGPMVGVTKTLNGFTLNSKGLWRIDLMGFFNFYTLGANQVDMDIRIIAPNGSIFLERFNHSENAGSITVTSLLSVVVPTSGYNVEVWAQAAAGRGILGGNSRSSLNVTKISNETS